MFPISDENHPACTCGHRWSQHGIEGACLASSLTPGRVTCKCNSYTPVAGKDSHPASVENVQAEIERLSPITYEVTEGNKEFGVADSDGCIVYDNLPTLQEATDICVVLNAGIGPEWDAVEAALERLVIVKVLA